VESGWCCCRSRAATYLKEHGHRVFPVDPQAREILGETFHPGLSSVPEPVDVVDVFRDTEEEPAIMEEAIRLGAKAIWIEEGVLNEEAAQRVAEAGLLAVMDRCRRKEHLKLFGASK